MLSVDHTPFLTDRRTHKQTHEQGNHREHSVIVTCQKNKFLKLLADYVCDNRWTRPTILNSFGKDLTM